MIQGVDFKKHISDEHDFWKYVKYLSYLHSKEKEDFTGFESLIWQNYCQKKIDWIPSADRISKEEVIVPDQLIDLDKNEEKEVVEESNDENTQELKEAISKLSSKIDDINTKLEGLSLKPSNIISEK